MTGALELADAAVDNGSGQLPTGPAACSSTTLSVLKADRLIYLADLTHEMETLARECQCQTLAALLAVAYGEAHQQIKAMGAG
jgi:hypothetical protein